LRHAHYDLVLRLKPWLERAGLWDASYLCDRHSWFFAVLDLLKPRVKRLEDFTKVGRFFFTDAIEYESAAVDKHLRVPGMDEHLKAFDAALTALEAFDPASIEAALRATADARGVKAASLIHAVRVTVTGQTARPGLFEVLALLGRVRVRARMAGALGLLSTSTS